MFKKVFLFSFVVGLVSLAACQKNAGKDVVRSHEPGSPVEVKVCITGTPGTRATGVSESFEKKVRSLQVFVFNGDALENHRSVTNSQMALVPATAGERTVWAVVNAPDIYSVLQKSDSDPMTLTKLKAHVSRLQDNVYVASGGEDTDPAGSNFIMCGSTVQELVDGGQVDISVKRIVARVSIEKISASLKDYRENYTIRINGVYLINVPLNTSLDLTADPTEWCNMMKLDANLSSNALLYDNLSGSDVVVRNNVYLKGGEVISEQEAYVQSSLEHGIYELAEGVTLQTDNAYRVSHVFYPYPNKLGSADARYKDESWNTWSPRGTILVIDATMVSDRDEDNDGNLDEIAGYYPIDLPAIERNKTYTIQDVKITRLPGDKPYRPIETGESKVVIEVHDWELGLDMGTITI
jgi:hypothetical protein